VFTSPTDYKKFLSNQRHDHTRFDWYQPVSSVVFLVASEQRTLVDVLVQWTYIPVLLEWRCCSWCGGTWCMLLLSCP